MAAVPLYSIGRHQTAFTLVGQTVGSDGTLTDATSAGSQSLLGMWDEIDVDMEPETEEISSSDATRQHNIILKEATKARFVQILRKALPPSPPASQKINPLCHLVNTYDILKMTLTNGGSTWTGYITRGNANAQYRKGKSTVTLNALACDGGTAVAYSEP